MVIQESERVNGLGKYIIMMLLSSIKVLFEIYGYEYKVKLGIKVVIFFSNI